MWAFCLLLLQIGEAAEAWVAQETKRNVAVKAAVSGGHTFKKLQVVDRKSFRSPSSRNHNRAIVKTEVKR
jgi:hypothetical protein